MPGSLSLASLHSRFVCYSRLTRLHMFPLGSIVICWPGVFGLALAAHQFPVPTQELLRKLLTFCLGGTLFHSAFCVYNDICDRDLDGRVERSKSRPLVSGEVTILEAWLLFFLVYAAGYLVMAFAGLNRIAVVFGLLSMPLHFLYPLAKRWTWLPQGWLGISNAWSFFVGWYAIAGKGSSYQQIKACIAMYIAMACWTTYFDTIYASQDRKDDATAGIKSSALLFGDRLRLITSCLAALTTFFLIATGTLNNHGPLYFLISCGGVAAHFSWQMSTWNVDDRERCGKLFKSNGDLGWILFSGILADTMFRSRVSTFLLP